MEAPLEPGMTAPYATDETILVIWKRQKFILNI